MAYDKNALDALCTAFREYEAGKASQPASYWVTNRDEWSADVLQIARTSPNHAGMLASTMAYSRSNAGTRSPLVIRDPWSTSPISFFKRSVRYENAVHLASVFEAIISQTIYGADARGAACVAYFTATKATQLANGATDVELNAAALTSAWNCHHAMKNLREDVKVLDRMMGSS